MNGKVMEIRPLPARKRDDPDRVLAHGLLSIPEYE